jgi:hypothetical protein
MPPPPDPASRSHGAIAQGLGALAAWRGRLDEALGQWAALLADHDLADEADRSVLTALHERVSADKLVLAFVAEFSRGKSELINAIFFADTGQRVLPATPGRTTMCPVELHYDDGAPPRLSLLPIHTRRQGLALAELRGRDALWQHVPLEAGRPAALAQALSAVTRTERVAVDDARALGLWSDEAPEDNPPQDEQGRVEVPAWRHAVINYPHPLLRQGLVVIDTPGLNAVGAEPELTLGLLPTAHAIVFVLAADAGVTRSDLSIWRDHLSAASLERFVVLNKIDTLADPLSTPAQVQEQIAQQRADTARLLDVPPERVYAVSAREALAARVERRPDAWGAGGPLPPKAGSGLPPLDTHSGLPPLDAHSGLPPLEQALAARLMPRQRELMVSSAVLAVQQVATSAARRLADRRRQHAEQLLELRGLRGKSSAKLRLMAGRVEAEIVEFERCTTRLAALRTVQARMLRTMLSSLSSESLRAEVAAMQAAMGSRPFRLGARPAFDALGVRLRAALKLTEQHIDEMRQMLEAGFRQLNADFGFAFVLGRPPTLGAYHEELSLIEQNYSRYLGLTQGWRLASTGFAEQFRRMLLSKLRVVFENAAGDVELWSKQASAQIDAQLRERRRGFARRRDALQRVQSAGGELEARIAEVQAQDDALAALAARVEAGAEGALRVARGLPPITAAALAPERNAA